MRAPERPVPRCSGPLDRGARLRALTAPLAAAALFLSGCAGHADHAGGGQDHGGTHEEHGPGHGEGDDGGHDHTSHNLSPPDQEPDPAPRGPEPASVRIPSLDVESELLHTGVRQDGTAEVPEDFDLASWYEEGGRTGEGRPTVLLGHVDSTDGPAVFARIDELADGDTVEVDDAEGGTHTYEVVDVQVHPYDEFPTFEVFSGSGGDVLHLVTCTGAFDPDEGSYEDNLVVFAENVEA